MSREALTSGSYGKGGAPAGDDEGDSEEPSSSGGQELLDAIDSGDAGAVGEAIRKAVIRCMAEQGE